MNCLDIPEPTTLEQAIRERDAWIDSWAQEGRNVEYYRGLLDKCAECLGPEVFMCDDGSTSDSPLRAKIPELVAKLSGSA